nr:di-heme oxidoredictase family protein [Flavobacterium sp.]
MWHAGEATNAKNAFKQLNVTEHTDLLNFINSMIFPG